MIRRRDGFTLIELLVVILIIGILAAIAIPSFLGQRDKAKVAQTKSALRSAETAARTYFTERQTFDGLSKAALEEIEPTLRGANWSGDWCNGRGGLWGAGDTYCIAMDADTKPYSRWEFRVDATYGSGYLHRVCEPVGSFGCKNEPGQNAGRWR